MKNFDIYYNNLLNHNKINNIQIKQLTYSKSEFVITLCENYFNQITNNDIIIMNHKTKQFRKFTFVSKSNSSIIFQYEDVKLIIVKSITD